MELMNPRFGGKVKIRKRMESRISNDSYASACMGRRAINLWILTCNQLWKDVYTIMFQTTKINDVIFSKWKELTKDMWTQRLDHLRSTTHSFMEVYLAISLGNLLDAIHLDFRKELHKV